MKKIILRSLSFGAQLLFMLVLPFLLLLRGSVWLYQAENWPYGLALLAMFAVVFVLLLIYVAMLYDWIVGPGQMTRRSIRFKASLVLLLMLGFLGYTLFHLQGSHAKAEAVQAEYTQLHPLLRLGLGTFILLDEDLLVTDLARTPHDYDAMGLPRQQRSLHYEQPGGYVHAMDLRTKGHRELRNRSMAIFFELMGFQTLRHVGTADHLHVALVP